MSGHDSQLKLVIADLIRNPWLRGMPHDSLSTEVSE